MLNKDMDINTVVALMASDPLLSIAKDYGDVGVEYFKAILKVIPQIFKNIIPKNFNSIIIFKSNAFDISTVVSKYQIIQDFSHLASIREKSIIIQVKSINEIFVTQEEIDMSILLKDNFFYQYLNEEESFQTKTKNCPLPQVAGSYSVFAVSTFKDLDEALAHYDITIAGYAKCPYIKDALLTEKRIFLKPKPEHLLRDSLRHFLEARLRGDSITVLPEQNVDETQPVDIKVAWGYTNHQALIEIKWLGKSLDLKTSTFTATYSEARAKEGAQQLANYLDAHKPQTPTHNTKGYLVVFDLRRNGTKVDTSTIDTVNGLHFKNKEIDYNPKFHETRIDFSKPVRLFIPPVCE